MPATHLVRCLVPLVLPTLGLATGCFFEDSIDVDDPPAASTGAASDATSSTDAPGTDDGTTTTGTPDGSTSLDPDDGTTASESSGSEASAGTGSASDSSGGGSTTGESCNPSLPSIHWASEATLTAPMVLTTALYLPGMPQMAYSTTAEAGTITFAFELECAAKISVQGLVWDFVQGTEPTNPDSLYAAIDGLPVPELEWPYGCATAGLGDESWSWQPLASGSRNGCALAPVEVDLEAGAHVLTLRNREAGDGFDIAAIAAVVVSEDPGLDASTLYDPNP